MALLINNESPQNIIYNGNEVLKVIYNDIVVWEKQNEQQVYKRRIMVGDNLRNKVVYGDFKMGYYVTLMNADEEDSITCNNNRLDTVYEYITSDYCSVDNNMHDSSSNLSLYEYDATNGTELLNNNSLIKNDKDYIVSEIIDNATYRHLFIKDPNIRPIQVGDRIVAGTKIYFTYPDNYYNQWAADGTYNDAVLIQLGINEEDIYKSFYHARYESGAMSVSLDFFDSFSGSSKYIYDTDDSGNVLTNISYVEFTQDEGEVTFVDPYNFEKIIKHILVDTTTLGNNEESAPIDTVTYYEGVADGLSLIISPCNTANYSNQSVITAVENFNSFENYSLENVLNDLQVDMEQEIVTLQGTLIDVLNYEIIRNFEINITDGADTYLDSANDGTILNYNGYFSMILGDLIDGIVEDYLLMIVNPNTMDVYFYEFNQESFNSLTGECIIEFNQFPNRDFLGPYFLLKQKE